MFNSWRHKLERKYIFQSYCTIYAIFAGNRYEAKVFRVSANDEYEFNDKLYENGVIFISFLGEKYV
jgi:hypothetical protein